MYYLPLPIVFTVAFTVTFLGPEGVLTVFVTGLDVDFDTALPLTRSEKEGPLSFFFAVEEEALGTDLVIFTGALGAGLGAGLGADLLTFATGVAVGLGVTTSSLAFPRPPTGLAEGRLTLGAPALELGVDLVIFTGGLATGLGGAFGTAVPTLLPEDGAVMFFLGPAEVEGDLTIALGALVLGLGGAGVVCLAFL
jgi:hypothetical protein